MINVVIVFFFNDTATTEIYTLSLHDALPISTSPFFTTPPGVASLTVATMISPILAYLLVEPPNTRIQRISFAPVLSATLDRKSTRLNSSHANISYAVFCLKKKIHHL